MEFGREGRYCFNGCCCGTVVLEVGCACWLRLSLVEWDCLNS